MSTVFRRSRHRQLKAEFDRVHKEGKDALAAGDYAALRNAIDLETKIIAEQAALIAEQKALIAKFALPPPVRRKKSGKR